MTRRPFLSAACGTGVYGYTSLSAEIRKTLEMDRIAMATNTKPLTSDEHLRKVIEGDIVCVNFLRNRLSIYLSYHRYYSRIIIGTRTRNAK